MVSSIPTPQKHARACVRGALYTYADRTARCAHLPDEKSVALDPVRGFSHDACRLAHQRARKRWQFRAAGGLRGRAMRDFVSAHCLHHRPSAQIVRGQPGEVLIQMPFNLTLGLDDEAEASAVAECGGERTDSERTPVPERVEIAGP